MLPSHYVTRAMRAVTLDVTPQPQSGGDAQALCLINASQHRRVMTHTRKHTHTLESGEGEKSLSPPSYISSHVLHSSSHIISLSHTHTHTHPRKFTMERDKKRERGEDEGRFRTCKEKTLSLSLASIHPHTHTHNLKRFLPCVLGCRNWWLCARSLSKISPSASPTHFKSKIHKVTQNCQCTLKRLQNDDAAMWSVCVCVCVCVCVYVWVDEGHTNTHTQTHLDMHSHTHITHRSNTVRPGTHTFKHSHFASKQAHTHTHTHNLSVVAQDSLRVHSYARTRTRTVNEVFSSSIHASIITAPAQQKPQTQSFPHRGFLCARGALSRGFNNDQNGRQFNGISIPFATTFLRCSCGLKSSI